MNDNNPTPSIQQSVLDKVRKGNVRRHTRLYFLLRIFATSFVGALALLTSALTISFILFSLHESGEQFLIGYGLRGIGVFLTLFPWISLVLAIVFITVFERLLRGFKFAYRMPVLHVLSAVTAASILLGILINLTPLHTSLLRVADQGGLSIIGNAYERIFDSHEDKGICRGEVTSVEGDTFVLHHDDYDRDADDGTSTIFVAPNTGSPMPHVGDRVFTFGNGKDGCKNPQHVDILEPSKRR